MATPMNEEIKHQFKEALGKEWQVYLSSTAQTGEYSIQLVKDNIQFQFEFHISKLEEAKQMVKEGNAFLGKYGIDRFIFRARAKELLGDWQWQSSKIPTLHNQD